MPDDAVVTEEGVKEKSPAPTNEEGAKTGEESPASQEEGVKEKSPAPRHASAEDRIKYLWREDKKKEAIIAEKERYIAELELEAAKKEANTGKPRREDFDTEEAFDDARMVFVEKRVDKKLAEEKARQRAEEDVRQRRQLWEGFDETAAKLDPAKYPDLDKAMNGDGVRYSGLSSEFVRTSPVGPQLAYHFYQNPDLATKIGIMPIYLQTEALLDLQSEIVKSAAPRISGAPNPVTPLGSGGGIVEKDPDKMTDKEWQEWRNRTKKIL